MKKKYLKSFFCVLLCLTAVIVLGAAVFYLLEIKPRINAAQAIGNAFAKQTGDGNILELNLEDGQKILLDLGSDDRLDGMVISDHAAYDGLEFGYMPEGIWIRLQEVSSRYYLLPWTDDVGEQIGESPLVSILGLDQEQKASLTEGLLGMRSALLEDEPYEFSPTPLNRILGLEGLKMDILDLYRGISFRKEGTEDINGGDETLSCTKYGIDISKEYVKPLLNTEGAGEILKILGDYLGDISLEIYLYQSELIYMEIQTSLLFMPLLSLSDFASGNYEAMLHRLSLSAIPLQGSISVSPQGMMETEVQITADGFSADTSFTWRMVEQDGAWKYEPDQTFNIFQAGYLELLLEAGKWEEELNGKGID